MRRLLDALLTDRVLQRARLTQALLAMALMLAGVAAMHYFVWVGIAPAGPVWVWSAASALGIGGAFVAIRSGWSERFADPSLTAAQMVYAIACCAAAYMLLGAGRGGVFPVVMVILMFGMFIATPRQMAWVSLYAVALFGGAMAVMAAVDPKTYPPRIELGHFVMVATMMPAVSILAARLARWRQRSREQRAELAQALARIRELATRDELTGLVNRRHLHELLEQEHQRCIRSGHTFCVAVLELDADVAGDDGDGDALLADVAQQAQRWVRVADVLGHWSRGRFVLLMSDSRAQLARGGLDRLRERVAEGRYGRDRRLRVALTASLAEHHAGETVAQTLARAEAALADACAQGEHRVVLS